MLNEDIRNLRSTLKSALEEGRLTRPMMVIAIDRLDALADQAEVLENLTIPLCGQINDFNLPPGVIRLASRLHRKGVRVGVADRPGRERS